jgi:hypothetical protein
MDTEEGRADLWGRVVLLAPCGGDSPGRALAVSLEERRGAGEARP